MKSFIRERSPEFFIALVSFFICLCFFTPVTDDYASFGSSCAAGQFSDYPYCDYYWGCLGINIIYRWLYLTLPAYDWMSLSFIAYEFCCLYLILRTIRKVIMAKRKGILLIRFIQVCFALFFIENIAYLSHTRSSLLFCGVALINLLFSDKLRKRDILENSFLFVFGMLLRPESSMGMLLLVSLGYVVHRFDILHILRRCMLPIAATAVMLSAYYIDWSHTDLFIKKVEPEVEYKLTEKRVVSLSTMHSAVDSIEYQAAVSGLCFDTRVLTPEYFRRILLPGADWSMRHASIRFSHVISLYRYYLFIPCYAIALLLLCLDGFGLRRTFFKMLCFLLLSFMIIFLLDYTGGIVSGRHFLNLGLISLLIISYYFFSSVEAYRPMKYTNLAHAIALSIIITGVSVTTYDIHKNVHIINDEVGRYELAMRAMDNLYINRIIVLTTDNFHLFDHVFSVKNKTYKRNKYLLYDVWTYWLSPRYLSYLQTQCNCDPLDPTLFMKWLSDHKALYIAEPWRYDLTSRYMYTIHGCDIRFEPAEGYHKPDYLQHLNMENYELRRISVK